MNQSEILENNMTVEQKIKNLELSDDACQTILALISKSDFKHSELAKISEAYNFISQLSEHYNKVKEGLKND